MNRGNFGTFAESFMGSLGKNVLLGQQMEENKKKRKIQELLTSGNPEDIQKAYLMSGDPKGGLDYRKSIEQQGAEQELQDVVNMPEGDEKRNALSRIMFKLGKIKEGIEFTKRPFDLKELGKAFNITGEKTQKTVKIGEGGQFEGLTISEGNRTSQNMKTYYQIDKKGNVIDSVTFDANDPGSLEFVRQEKLVPANDPRITSNRQQVNINVAQAGQKLLIQGADGSYSLVTKGTGKSSPITESETGEKVYKLPPSEIKTMHISLKDNLASANEAWKTYQQGKVEPGFIRGKVRQWGSKYFDDKEFTRLKRQLGQLRTIIYGLSGKQINESEQIWLKEDILPELIQPSANFEVAMGEFMAWVNRRKSIIEEGYPALRGVAGGNQTGGQTSGGNRFKVKEIQ